MFVPAAGFSEELNSAERSCKQTQTDCCLRSTSLSNLTASVRILTLDRPLLEGAGKYTDLEALDPAEQRGGAVRGKGNATQHVHQSFHLEMFCSERSRQSPVTRWHHFLFPRCIMMPSLKSEPETLKLQFFNLHQKLQQLINFKNVLLFRNFTSSFTLLSEKWRS